MNNKIALAARIILGAIFFIFGLNGFFNFIPQPALPLEAQQFMMALAGSGYFFPVLKITEIICGALLLSGYFVPLALVILAPIVVNIFLFHLFLAPSGLPMPIIQLVTGIYLAYANKSAYKKLLQAK